MMERASSILYTHGGGRFGNQLLRFLHWIAWAQEQGDRRHVINMAFWPYAELFATWENFPGCAFPVRRGWPDLAARARGLVPQRFRSGFDWRIQRCASAVSRRLGWAGISSVDLREGEHLDLETSEPWRGIADDRRVVLSGWQVTCWNLLERHAAEVRKLFAPRSEHAERVATFLAGCRSECDVLVGLLVRQGDYREWNEGRYFFHMTEYAAWISGIDALFPGRRVGIVVAGDVQLDEVAFAMPRVRLASGSVNRGGHWFESFLELAGCDLIVSPPSTFSACAAFLGEKPILPLRTSGQRLDPEDMLRDHLFGAARDPDFGQAVR